MISALILITINLGHFKIYATYGNHRFHETNVSATNETFKPKHLTSNIIRNLYKFYCQIKIIIRF